jgi:hypothetical protein
MDRFSVKLIFKIKTWTHYYFLLSHRDADSEPDDNPAAGDTKPRPADTHRVIAFNQRRALVFQVCLSFFIMRSVMD